MQAPRVNDGMRMGVDDAIHLTQAPSVIDGIRIGGDDATRLIQAPSVSDGMPPNTTWLPLEASY